MVVNISEQYLKKMSREFRIIAGRLLHSSCSDVENNLARFLKFIEDELIISNFIQQNNIVKYDIENAINSRASYEYYQLPIEKTEEIAFTYQLLCYGNEHYSNNYLRLCSMYSSGGGYQNWVDSFNNHVVLTLVRHITQHLEEMSIDMGIDDNSKTKIQIGKVGQFNLAQDSSTINASQVNGVEEKLSEIATELLSALMKVDIPQQIKEESQELIETVVEQVESDKPRKSIIKSAIEKVQGISQLVTKGNELTQGSHDFVLNAQKFVDWIQCNLEGILNS